MPDWCAHGISVHFPSTTTIGARGNRNHIDDYGDDEEDDDDEGGGGEETCLFTLPGSVKPKECPLFNGFYVNFFFGMQHFEAIYAVL